MTTVGSAVKMNRKVALVFASMAIITIVAGGLVFAQAQGNSTPPSTPDNEPPKFNGCAGPHSIESHLSMMFGGLTTEQHSELQATVQALKDSGATPQEIYSAAMAKLQEWGYELTCPGTLGTGMMGGYDGYGMMNRFRNGNGGLTPGSSSQPSTSGNTALTTGDCY